MLQALAKCVHLWSDVAEIFREERQSAESFAEFHKKIIARAVDPAAVDSRSVTRGNLPELVEAPEVIQPNVIKVARRPTQALNPPADIHALSSHPSGRAGFPSAVRSC